MKIICYEFRDQITIITGAYSFPMRLLAISDLHLSKLVSLDPVKKIANHLNDWLILAGDIAENTEFFARGARDPI